jgi:hypothetical protein
MAVEAAAVQGAVAGAAALVGEAVEVGAVPAAAEAGVVAEAAAVVAIAVEAAGAIGKQLRLIR